MKKDHPYTMLPEHAFWKRSVTRVNARDVDPVTSSPFRLTTSSKIATAGSCFAQNLSLHLQRQGYNFLVTEKAHPVLTPEIALQNNYGIYTARYGNIYTARQLLQLLQRAYGDFTPSEDAWQAGDGSWIDPFRPQIQPRGFASREEFARDRDTHFSAVREAVENLDVFIFTLGLTESWMSREDGAVFPLCPGVSGGEFDSEQYAFRNFSVDEVCSDMQDFVAELGKRNPSARLILTVSPVPLVATAAGPHVLVSTTYSKSVLRVACERLCQDNENVSYFPSYEIITGNFTRGAYFEEDLRSVTEEGVNHVMRVFFRHYGEERAAGTQVTDRPGDRSHLDEMIRLSRANCDEELLDMKKPDSPE